MKKILLFIYVSMIWAGYVLAQQTVDHILEGFNAPASESVLVVSHRADWRNAPENSLQAIQNCIDMGVDMVEIDLKRTKDGHLILMHDKTIDRTTTGKGRPEDFTLAELHEFRMRNGAKIFINSLWPELCGGHDDDRAVELHQPDESWGWIIGQGAKLVQTDRPALLLEYLKAKKLHE